MLNGQYGASELKRLRNNHAKYTERIINFLKKFKTNKCTNPVQHALEDCLDYHSPQERRRNPYTVHTFVYYPDQECECGNENCANYHSTFEKRYHPLCYKLVQCPDYYKCPRGLLCPNVHDEDLLHFEQGQFFRFDINLFKTEACYRKELHERKTCLYYHNERDRRRSNFSKYKHIPCSKQGCVDENCEWAHNKIEQLYHPSRYKSKFCQAYPNKLSTCEYRDFCSFAHNEEEIAIEIINLQNKDLNYIVNTFKTVWCPYTQNHDRSNCIYAHNYQDYRRKPREHKYYPERCEFWNFSDEIKSIEEAGCEKGMKCNKCHGWMEYRYHPNIYKKNSKKASVQRKSFAPKHREPEPALQKKDRTFCKEQASKNTNTYSIGAPFFKQERENSEASRKTKAKTINLDSEKSNDDSSQPSQVKEGGISRGQSQRKIALIVFEEEDHAVWGKNFPTIGEKEESRSKSQGRSDEHDIHYSRSIKETLDNEFLLRKLREKGVNELNLINLNDEKAKLLGFEDYKERETLLRKLEQYRLKREIRPIEYSRNITRFFIGKNCQNILLKMQSKKVKESNLLNLGSKDIRELSFLEEKEKAILPKLLKQLRSDLQFADLNDYVKRSTLNPPNE